MDNSFKKSERLHKKKEINFLFEEGNSFFSYPYRIKWAENKSIVQQGVPVQILISVSKRGFKNAVDRNQIKRLIREAYRTQKSILWDAIEKDKGQFHFAIMYIGKKVESFQFHQKAVEKLLLKLKEEILNK